MHYAANGMIQHLSGAINGLVLIAWAGAGFDARRCAQTAGAIGAIEASFVIGLPLLSLVTAVIALAYPIQGERLALLRERMGDSPKPKGGKPPRLAGETASTTSTSSSSA